jgi:hypothetical protein
MGLKIKNFESPVTAKNVAWFALVVLGCLSLTLLFYTPSVDIDKWNVSNDVYLKIDDSRLGSCSVENYIVGDVTSQFANVVVSCDAYEVAKFNSTDAQMFINDSLNAYPCNDDAYEVDGLHIYRCFVKASEVL